MLKKGDIKSKMLNTFFQPSYLNNEKRESGTFLGTKVMAIKKSCLFIV